MNASGIRSLMARCGSPESFKATAVTIPEVYSDFTQDGLLGMTLHPGLLKGTGNDYVYVAYTYDADAGPAVSRRGKLRRYTYNNRTGSLENPLDLITDLPAGSDHIAFRLVFGPDNKLYLSIGDQGSNWLQNYCNPNRAQDLPTAAEVRARDWTKYQGKMLRLNPDGSIPPDNPALAGVRSHILSYGHRNPQGLVFGPAGRLYESEHGPDTDDEVNIIEAGKNYGWPNVAGYNDNRAYAYANWSASSPEPCRSLTFSSTAIPPSVPQQKESAWSHPDFKAPIKTFFTVAEGYDPQRDGAGTVAPSGLDIYTARDGISGWADSLLMLSLSMGRVYRVKLNMDGISAGEYTELFRTANRYRDIAIRNSKTIYLSTDAEGRTMNRTGQSTRDLENPGAILEFTYTGP